VPFSPSSILAGLGVLFFVAHVVFALCGVHVRRGDRDGQLEALGKSVPGMAGLLLGLGCWLIPSIWAMLPMLAALLTLMLGRPVYELIVFGRRRGNG